MPSAAELKADGYLSFAELVEAVAAKVRNSAVFVGDLLPSRLNKVKAAMVFTNDVVQPDDYKRRHLYHQNLVAYIVQLWKLSDFGRVSLVDSVDLYRAFRSDDKLAVQELVSSVKAKQTGQKNRPKKRRHLRVAS